MSKRVGWHLQPADGQDDGAERDVAHLGSLLPGHDRSVTKLSVMASASS